MLIHHWHWRHLLESGIVTKDAISCLKYRAADIIEQYKLKKMPLPKIPPNPNIIEVDLRKKKLKPEDIKQITMGIWPNLRSLYLCKLYSI